MIIAFVRFNFDWMIVCVVAMGLSVANVVGYTKCSSDAKSKAQMAQVRLTVIHMRRCGVSALARSDDIPYSVSNTHPCPCPCPLTMTILTHSPPSVFLLGAGYDGHGAAHRAVTSHHRVEDDARGRRQQGAKPTARGLHCVGSVCAYLARPTTPPPHCREP